MQSIKLVSLDKSLIMEQKFSTKNAARSVKMLLSKMYLTVEQKHKNFGLRVD